MKGPNREWTEVTPVLHKAVGTNNMELRKASVSIVIRVGYASSPHRYLHE